MLIITGTVAYDYIMDFPGNFSDHILPSYQHKINLSFIVNNFKKRRGGTAGNVSYTLSLLKTKNILFSIGGSDFVEYKNAFSKFGVSVDYVKIDKKTYTATGFAMTDKKDNQIWGYFYGAAENTDKLKLEKAAKPKDLVLIGPSGAKGSMSFVRQCVDKKISYMFDPGFILTQVSNKDLEFGIQNAKYIIGNDYEIKLMEERIKNWQKIILDKIVITTLGEKGSIILENGKKIDIASVKPEKVIDPTGAGDAWRAGFLAGIERGYNLKICGQMGSTASSFAVEKYGTQEHSFTLNFFKKRYKKAFGDETVL